MGDPARERMTGLLARIADGEIGARDDLLALVYDELRGVAAAQMGRERPARWARSTDAR